MQNPYGSSSPGRIDVIPKTAEQTRPSGNASGRSIARILVADDDFGIRDVLRYRLEHAGHEVRTARSGVDALKQLSIECPDILIIDMMMPDISGMDVLREMRECAGGTMPKVIVITARIDKANEAGALGHLVIEKPFSVNALAALVQDLAG